jgi:tRNA (guanine-N7-)-methyltransferase
LTSLKHVAEYAAVLRAGGFLEFKTDNEDFFFYSREQFLSAGFSLVFETHNLYHDSSNSEGVQTEYERKFIALGKPIFCLRGRMGKAKSDRIFEQGAVLP